MPIVTVEEGRRIGTLKGAAVDVARGRLAYLRFAGEGRPDGVVPWNAVRAVGTDAITIESVGTLMDGVPSAERGEVCDYVGDRPVVTESGERLGTVSSYEVNTDTGEIGRYHVNTGGLIGRLTGSRIVFPHTAIRAFGRDAIVIADDVINRKAA
jgi:sporulation protein YlmC with PRC-barrel domain